MSAKKIPIYPPPATDRPPLEEMYRKDAASPWHQKWGGATSADERARIEKAFKATIAAKKARGEAQ